MIPDTQILRDAYQKAPGLVQQFITSPELESAFTEIRERHKLHLDEAGALSSALNAVFLEVVPYEQFPKLLKEALEQNSNQYDAVLAEVNNKIFTVFRKKITGSPDHETPAITPVISTSKNSSAPSIEGLQKEPTREASPRPTPNRLETSVRQAPQDVEIKSEPQKNAGYSTGADPYREPIE